MAPDQFKQISSTMFFYVRAHIERDFQEDQYNQCKYRTAQGQYDSAADHKGKLHRPYPRKRHNGEIHDIMFFIFALAEKIDDVRAKVAGCYSYDCHYDNAVLEKREEEYERVASHIFGYHKTGKPVAAPFRTQKRAEQVTEENQNRKAVQGAEPAIINGEHGNSRQHADFLFQQQDG